MLELELATLISNLDLLLINMCLERSQDTGYEVSTTVPMRNLETWINQNRI